MSRFHSSDVFTTGLSGPRGSNLVDSATILKATRHLLADEPETAVLGVNQTFILAETAVRAYALGDHGAHDIVKVQRALRAVVDHQRMTPVQRGVALAHALSELKGYELSQVALGLVHSLRDPQLHAVGRGGLLALRAACEGVEPELNSAALTRIDTELAARGPLQIRVSHQMAIVGEDIPGSALRLAARRVARLSSDPQYARSLQGMVLVLAPEEEHRTDLAIYYAHAKACSGGAPADFRQRLDGALERGDFLVLEEERMLVEAIPFLPPRARSMVVTTGRAVLTRMAALVGRPARAA